MNTIVLLKSNKTVEHGKVFSVLSEHDTQSVLKTCLAFSLRGFHLRVISTHLTEHKFYKFEHQHNVFSSRRP